MAKAKMAGTGWHKDSLRHSNARKFGRAGGTYKTISVNTKYMSDPKYKRLKKAFPKAQEKGYELIIPTSELTYKQLKKAGVKISPNGDADGDGVKNKKDCRPLNKYAQDNGMPAPNQELSGDNKTQIAIETIEAVPKLASDVAGVAKEGISVVKTGEEQIGGIIQKGEEIIIEKEKTKQKSAWEKAQESWSEFQDARKKEKEAEKKRQQSRIVKELETEEYLTQDDLDRINDLDPRELNEKELKILAIREGEEFFGGNKYEQEILRRIKSEAKVETDKTIEINKQKVESARRIAESNPETKKDGGSGEDFFTWLTKPN